MDLDNMAMARMNIEQFNDRSIKYINKAIWLDSKTILEYAINQEPNSFSVVGNKKQGKYRQCRTISMEELIFNENLNNKIVICKMDIEGVEKQLFNQINNTWLQSLDYFYVEYHEFNDNDKKHLIITASENNLELINEFDYWSFNGWGGFLFEKRANIVEL